MKKYYVIALVAIAAILILLIGNIKGRYDGYVQEMSKQIDKSLDIAMEEELGIRQKKYISKIWKVQYLESDYTLLPKTLLIAL